MRKLEKIIGFVDWINKWVGKICYPCMILICITVLIEIAMRSLFSKPTVWASETTQMLYILCSFIAGGHILRKKEHIVVDIFYSKFSLRTRLIIDIATFPFFLLFAGALLWFGSGFAVESLLKLEHSGSVWDPPLYPIKFIVPLSAFLILLQGITNLIRDILAYKNQLEST
jgi:TRAP-type mannitol/chloroaromatic compound transport system permease small subunit